MIETYEYRREIDGLRMIAVLSVVFFHFGLPGFRGGFIGVDIFFVISGFLIGGVLWKEYKREHKISVSSFYFRRLRRLAPAYITMCAITLILGWFILLPFEYREFGKGLIASLFYVSNVLFYRQSGYFDSAAEDKALLHTWSLSVEEQFYIFIPIAIILIRNSRCLVLLFSFIFISSLIASILYTPLNHSAAFFLTPFRLWELMAGVILSIYGIEKKLLWKGNPAISWVGIFLIIFSFTLISPSDLFPGYIAIFPVLGTTLVILNGKDENPVNKFLSCGFSRFFGLISYSLYLWHWPILVLSLTYLGTFGSTAELIGTLLLVLLLSVLSWRFIEAPTRRKNLVSNSTLMLGSIGSVVLLLLSGGLIYLNDGYVDRFPDRTKAFIHASQDFLQDWSRCEIIETGPLQGIETCAFGVLNKAPEVIVWGDSHVRALREGLDLVAQESDVAGLIIWNAGCPPFFDVKKTESAATQEEDAQCTYINSKLRKGFKTLKSVERILLVGRWSYYATGEGVGIDSHNTINLSRPFNQGLSNTVNDLSSWFDVYALQQFPEFPNYSSHVFAKRLAHGRDVEDHELEIDRQTWEARAQSSDSVLHELALQDRLHLIDTWPHLCNETCRLSEGGKVYYFDNNHLTNTGAIQFRYVFSDFMKGTHERTD